MGSKRSESKHIRVLKVRKEVWQTRDRGSSPKSFTPSPPSIASPSKSISGITKVKYQLGKFASVFSSKIGKESRCQEPGAAHAPLGMPPSSV